MRNKLFYVFMAICLVFSISQPSMAKFTDYVGAGHWDPNFMGARASSEFLYLGEPLNKAVLLADGTGLNGDLHSTTGGDMWLTEKPPAGPRIVEEHPAATNDLYWVEFDLGESYGLDDMWVWNYGGVNNYGDFTDRGLKDVYIKTSVDGVNWTLLSGPGFGSTHQFAKTNTGQDVPFAHNTEIDFGGIIARYVLIYNAPWNANTVPHWGTTSGYWGLSEVRFNVLSIEKAYDPFPSDLAEGVDLNVEISWSAGDYATSYDIYFSKNLEAVANRDPNAFVGTRVVSDLNFDPGDLDYAETYYWCVDGTDGSNDWPGDIWSFTVQNPPFVTDGRFYDYIGAGNWDPCDMEVRASSEYLYLGQPYNTASLLVNGSGLSGNLHSTYGGDMWLTNHTPRFFEYHPEATNNYYWIAFDFGHLYSLDNMWVWNYGAMNAYGDFSARGLKDVFIKTSIDGEHWTQLQGPGLRGTHQFAKTESTVGVPFSHNTQIDFNGIEARYVLVYSTPYFEPPLEPEWGAYVGQWGLSEVRFNVDPIRQAFEPSPANRSEGIDENVELSWMPGDTATSHIIYFGTDSDAVSNGDVSVEIGNQAMPDTTFAPGALDFGQTYYWRVDATDGTTVWQGDVWEFMVANYLVVDDFESYDGGSLPAAWQSIGGAAASLETSLSNQGQQSMKVDFSDTSSVSFTVPFADWTSRGVQALVLCINGDTNNASTANQLYVRLEDGVNSSTVNYAGSSDDLIRDSSGPWLVWNIDLGDFTSISLTNVTKITVGITGTSSDTIYVDDIRLYLPRCTGQFNPGGDVTADCTTDYDDLQMLLENWLLSGYTTDGYPGQLVNYAGDDSQWISGKINGALKFDGVSDQKVLIPALAVQEFHDKTIAMWIRADANDVNLTNNAHLFFAYAPDEDYVDDGYLARLFISDTGWISAACEHYTKRVYDASGPIEIGTGRWYHVALVLRDTSDTHLNMELYIDGTLQAQLGDIRQGPDLNTGVAVGGRGDNDATPFLGAMDDFMIYDYPLSAAEISALANQSGYPAGGPKLWYKFDETSGFIANDSGVSGVVYNPLSVPEADTNNDGEIDFADFASVAETWLETNLWPEI